MKLSKGKGWIKLHRKIQDCFIWTDKPYDKARAWVDLLLLATHSDKKMIIDGMTVVISRGSYMTSREKLAKNWGWSVGKVDRFLKTLESEEMITTNRTPKGTVVTIVNYSEYQAVDIADDTADSTTDDTTDRTSDSTLDSTSDGIQNKNYKECIKNERDNTHAREDEIQPLQFDVEKVWKDTYKVYPKQSYSHSAKIAWLDLFKGVSASNQLNVAKMIVYAIKLYLDDYKKQNPDDDTFRYVPRFDTWLKEDCMYWIGVYEEKVRDK